MISLNLMKSSAVRIAGDQPKWNFSQQMSKRRSPNWKQNIRLFYEKWSQQAQKHKTFLKHLRVS